MAKFNQYKKKVVPEDNEHGVYSPKERINNQIIDLFNGIVGYWEQYKIDHKDEHLINIYGSLNVIYLWLKNSIKSLGGDTYNSLYDNLKKVHDSTDVKILEGIDLPLLLEDLSSFLFESNYISGEYRKTAVDFNKICEQYIKEIE